MPYGGTTMNPKQRLIERCRELGLGLTDEGEKLEVFCPHGKVLATTECHFQTFWTKGWKRNDLYEDILADLSMGLRDCDEPNCEVCEEPGIPDDVPPACVLVPLRDAATGGTNAGAEQP